MEDKFITYGEVSGELCANCNKCSDYELSLDYKYTKFLFISFGERNHKYFLRCKNCRVYSEISRPKAQYIADTKFGEFERKRKRKLHIKNAALLLLAGALVFGTVTALLNSPDMAYKNLIADKPDGYYEIYDKEGNLCAQITKDGAPRYDLLVRRGTYEEEDYRDSSEDLYYEYYYSDQDGDLKYIEENAGALLDKNGIGIRYYFYDTAEKDIFYNFGVDNLHRITYSENRALYPMTYYSDEYEYYWKVYEKSENCEILLLFRDSKGPANNNLGNFLKPAESTADYSGDRLQTAEVYTLDNGNTIKYEYYDFSWLEDLPPGVSNLNRQSGMDSAVEALKASGIKPLCSEEYTYYKDTEVVESAVAIYRDDQGMERTDYLYYSVEEKDGYYIVTEIKNKQPGSPALMV